MEKRRRAKAYIVVMGLLVIGFCLLATFILFGSGLIFWHIDRRAPILSRATQSAHRTPNLVELPTPPVPLASPTVTLIPAVDAAPSNIETSIRKGSEAPTSLPVPTDTVVPTHPPTATPLPPTITATPSPLLPTATPLPTDTSTPALPDYSFVIKEIEKFDTGQPNLDVYIAITDANNTPLSDYRVVGTHDTGLQIESSISAGAWTENSGANHYKAGNIKYVAPNSPSGIWTLQLVGPDGNPASPPIAFPFDANRPSWYFLFYERQ